MYNARSLHRPHAHNFVRVPNWFRSDQSCSAFTGH